MKIEDLVDYIDDMNKERAYKHLMRRQTPGRVYSAESTRPDLLRLSSFPGQSNNLPIAEVKDTPVTPLQRRGHTVAEFNIMRRRNIFNDSSRQRSLSDMQPLLPAPQFPPIETSSPVSGRISVQSAKLHRQSSLPDTGDHAATVTYTSGVQGRYRVDLGPHTPIPSPIETGLDIVGIRRTKNSSVESSKTTSGTDSEDKLRQSIMAGSRSGQGRNQTSLYKKYSPHSRDHQVKQVSFNERVSFIDTYALENDNEVTLSDPDREKKLLLTSQNLQLLETISKHPTKTGNSAKDDSNNNFLATKPVKEVRLLSWLHERQVEVEEPSHVIGRLDDDIIHEDDEKEDGATPCNTLQLE